MNRKVWLIIAFVLIITGVMVFSLALSVLKWDFNGLGTVKYTTDEYSITDKFNSISINADIADVSVNLAEDGVCKIICVYEEKYPFTVSVKDNTLNITRQTERQWTDFIGINSDTTSVSVYLPPEQYGRVYVDVSTGDVLINGISCSDIVLEGSTGDVKLNNISATNEIFVDLSTGSIYTNNCVSEKIQAECSTGDIYFDKTESGNIYAECSTGNILFNESDAQEIYAECSTGDIKGNLLSEKTFFAETSTGDVIVPPSKTGGKCELVTSTGDIKIEITNGAF